ncbi:MAG TPA: putative baseplate assembly protein [Candidatus Angelobacter sp.]|jgi:hypothetical protein
MNDACSAATPVLCGCCEGMGPETPQPISNRPALSAISYRVGTHARFKASMLAALSAPVNAALSSLRTRDDSDFTIALLDAFAVTADVLSFYNERIANEAYLRTAMDQRSVFQLARLVGYRPSPGVAASAFIAFTLNDAAGSPDNVVIKAGTRVQSVPGPGQSPAVFETSTDVTATIAGNAIPAQTTVPWALSKGDTSATFRGTALKVNPGDGLLFVDTALHSSLASGAADFHYVASVAVNSIPATTTIHWDDPLDDSFGTNNTGVFVYVFRKKAALFGVSAPDPRPMNANNPYFPNTDWPFQYTSGSMQVNLDASYSGLVPATGGEPQWAVFTSPDVGVSLFQITDVSETGPALYTLTAKTTHLQLALGLVLVNNAVIAALEVFIAALQAFLVAIASGSPGAIAAALVVYENALLVYINLLSSPPSPDQLLGLLVGKTRDTTAFVQRELLPPADPPFIGPWVFDATYARQADVLKPTAGADLEIEGGQDLSNGQPVAISGQRLRLQVSNGSAAAFVPDGATGALAVADKQIFLVDAFPPNGSEWRVTTTTNAISGSLNAPDSNVTFLPADKSDPPVSESAVISRTIVSGDVTILSFDGPLTRIYDRATVKVNANTAAATHGETMHEILGSGDATNAALQFSLKQSPLTHVSSSSSLGAQSTLQVWVNNLQWHETENFLDSGPADRVFISHINDKQIVTVQFGDGIAGARTPSGQMNIRAAYRKGIGTPGMVQAGQLSQPLDRPQGLKSSFNPDPASGGADLDTAADARMSAPLHVLTLDRVVSLEDYQNFARAFSGIAKALATWTWFGQTRGVFLTVAGSNGSTFQPGDPTIVNLAKALAGAGNPFVPLMVVSYVPVLFEISANVRVDSANYDPAEVLGRVWNALADAFSFSNRDIGQGVAQSEALEIIQQCAGVVAVEVTAFQLSQDVASTPSPAVLRAASPVAGGNTAPQPGQMLQLDPASRGSIGAWS